MDGTKELVIFPKGHEHTAELVCDFLNSIETDKDLSWYIDRIGKKVYRTDLKTCCDNCRENAQKGVVILDAEHAEVLYTYSRELGVKYEDLLTNGSDCTPFVDHKLVPYADLGENPQFIQKGWIFPLRKK